MCGGFQPRRSRERARGQWPRARGQWPRPRLPSCRRLLLPVTCHEAWCRVDGGCEVQAFCAPAGDEAKFFDGDGTHRPTFSNALAVPEKQGFEGGLRELVAAWITVAAETAEPSWRTGCAKCFGMASGLASKLQLFSRCRCTRCGVLVGAQVRRWERCTAVVPSSGAIVERLCVHSMYDHLNTRATPKKKKKVTFVMPRVAVLCHTTSIWTDGWRKFCLRSRGCWFGGRRTGMRSCHA